ncbi:hypothetical protein ALP63_102120 [Pseudomonas syringae pv. aceris]|nr:hypothetical protein ALP69_101739 [Pseudomonas syringae pv. aceris]RMS59279.1 hypothetical protein ALP63_102120 [Pseudomonas syringae pv. aceris]RMS71582.1 hypothetical protein ALP62_102096 [Pseudomonas syringae pv. aceris]
MFFIQRLIRDLKKNLAVFNVFPWLPGCSEAFRDRFLSSRVIENTGAECEWQPCSPQ